jgi:hypothetical protein
MFLLLPRNGATSYIELKSSKKQGPLDIFYFLSFFFLYDSKLLNSVWNKEELPDQ